MQQNVANNMLVKRKPPCISDSPNHKSNIKQHGTSKSKNLPIGKHLTLPDHTVNNISIMGIENIHNKSDDTLLCRESYWILKLQTWNQC